MGRGWTRKRNAEQMAKAEFERRRLAKVDAACTALFGAKLADLPRKPGAPTQQEINARRAKSPETRKLMSEARTRWWAEKKALVVTVVVTDYSHA